jgi:NADPH2 dehydrogenase
MKVYIAEPLDMRMSDPDIIETFTYLASELKNRHPNMAYLHAGEPRVGGGNDLVAAEGDSLEFLVSLIVLLDLIKRS